MRNKKAVIWSVVGCTALLSLFWFAMSVRTAVYGLHKLEKQGHAYRQFFVVLDQHTQETGELPDSFDELLFDQPVIEYWESVWQEDVAYLQELIGPDFSVSPSKENLSAFVPGYKTNASWAYSDCEWYWELVVENCNPDK